MKNYTFEYKYSQEGDIIIGGIFTVHSWVKLWREKGKTFYNKMCIGAHPREYTHLRAFLFAIEEINNRSDILPNVTLGYHIYDSCGHENKVIKDVLQILSGHTVTAPNYSCMENDAVVGFIGDLHSGTTLTMAQLLSLYGYPHLSHYIKEDNILLNENGDWITPLYIMNWVVRIYEGNEIMLRPVVGRFDASFPEDKQLDINPQIITWRHNSIPKGRCNDLCPSGTRKVLREGYHICCYDCIPCPEGEFTNHSDSENCQRCPEDEWPNEKKNKCVLRDYEFLSYESDVLSIVFSIFSILFSLITVFIIGIFTLFRKSPIVRANNQNLSFILLTSLMFSLLCVFLFIGRPVDITCMLRQIFFGIFFTVAVSSVLAKTIIVCIAFKATRPESSWRKCVGVKLPYSVVLVCSSLQILNAVIWLSLSPPYQELNLDYPGKIIIQCNEGSVLAFYLMLGYMGFLAAVSFVLAFMVRTLPDIYNEAKYITFSMLVFCSVWIAAIPAYLSSTGKHMVTVEIFAILASGGGILICMFLPKCYNILMDPEVNSKGHLSQRRVM
ncbi:extracellular calcium-sensing receptor-like [Hyla sarda]|uniref:extracellular calcium-sensing receptor-like n=1 Tax=Hyla sarda TaxID=327740 RepID=UPI0024C37809|nr:extracellular calcium-sensing receptor-like [Hyla sarda]